MSEPHCPYCYHATHGTELCQVRLNSHGDVCVCDGKRVFPFELPPDEYGRPRQG